MIGRLPTDAQPTLWSPVLADLVRPDHALVKLTKRLDWAAIEAEFTPLYCVDNGRPCIPIRVMVSLILLQRMFDVSDEVVVKQWAENYDWQYFSGMVTLQQDLPCDPSELVRFRRRMGAKGCEALLKWSVAHHQERGSVQAEVVVIDSTVQAKNVMIPRDHKLYRRVAERLLALAETWKIVLRRSYRRTIKKQIMQLRTANFPKARKQAARATRKLRTIAGRLLRNVQRHIPDAGAERHWEELDTMERIVTQGQGGPDHVYSLHEPQMHCIARGKDHAQFEFGTKVSLVIDPKSGVVVGAKHHRANVYDGHVTAALVTQVESLTGTKPHTVIGDQGYRDQPGHAKLAAEGVTVITPDQLRNTPKGTPAYRKLRTSLRWRSRIEAVIGHLKAEHRLCRNFLAGTHGDDCNVLLAVTGWNLRKLLRMLWLSLQTLVLMVEWTIEQTFGRSELAGIR